MSDATNKLTGTIIAAHGRHYLADAAFTVVRSPTQ